MIASDPQKMLFAHASWPVKTDCHSPFTPSFRRRDDPNNPQFDRRPMGAVSILRGRLALELSPCAERSRQRSAPSPPRPGRIPSAGATSSSLAATIERWYYAARHGHDDPVGALRRAVRKDRGKISLAAALAERLILQYRDHPRLELSTPLRQPRRLGEGRARAGAAPLLCHDQTLHAGSWPGETAAVSRAATPRSSPRATATRRPEKSAATKPRTSGRCGISISITDRSRCSLTTAGG